MQCLFEDYYRKFLKGFCNSFSKTVEENAIPAGGGMGFLGPPPLKYWSEAVKIVSLNAQSVAFIPTR